MSAIEEKKEKFILAMLNLVNAIKIESEKSRQLCGDLNERELSILVYVGGHKTVKMSDIVEQVNAPFSTLTGIIDKLVEKKYLTRVHSEGDRRVIVISLGAKGKKIYTLLAERKQSMAEKVLKQVNEKEQNKFIDMIQQLAAALNHTKE